MWSAGTLDGVLLRGLRFGIVLLLITPPTVMMGGTLPALISALERTKHTLGQRIALLYGVNSLGAVIGGLLCALWLLPAGGYYTTLYLAAAVNILAGVVFVWLDRGTPALTIQPAAPTAPPLSHAARWFLVPAFLGGFISLAGEMIWIRLLVVVLDSSVQSFAIIVAAYILGITLGSLIVRRWVLPPERARRIAGACLLAMAGILCVQVLLWQELPFLVFQLRSSLDKDPANFGLYTAMRILISFVWLVGPAAAAGMLLPVLAQAQVTEEGQGGALVGRLFAWNTAGAVLGALSVLWLLPLLGAHNGLVVLAGIAATAGVFFSVRHASIRPYAAAVVVLVAVVGGFHQWDLQVAYAGIFRLQPELSSNREGFLARLRYPELLFHKDDGEVVVQVTELEDGTRSLFINGKADASASPLSSPPLSDEYTQALLGHLPMLLAPTLPQRALVVGLGSGQTASALARHDMEQIDVIEISDGIIETVDLFSIVNGDWLSHPSVTIHHDDARSFLSQAGQYDLVVSEPSNLWMAGVAELYTVEYLTKVREHLSEDGLLVQWLNAYAFEDVLFADVIATISSVFPSVTVWNMDDSDLLIVAQASPDPADGAALHARISARLAEPAVARSLSRLRISNPAAVLSLQSLDDPTTQAIAQTGDLLSVYHPRIEYEAPRAFFAGQRIKMVRRLDSRQDALLPGQTLFHRLSLAQRPLSGLAPLHLGHVPVQTAGSLTTSMLYAAAPMSEDRLLRIQYTNRLALLGLVTQPAALDCPTLLMALEQSWAEASILVESGPQDALARVAQCAADGQVDGVAVRQMLARWGSATGEHAVVIDATEGFDAIPIERMDFGRHPRPLQVTMGIWRARAFAGQGAVHEALAALDRVQPSVADLHVEIERNRLRAMLP